MVVLTILGVLFLALIILVPLMERFAKPMKDDEVSRISRWILPLVALLLVIQLIAHWVK
ncbi:MAG: hypothetical protein K6L80_09690 [Agarilytica sp.]